MERLFFVGPGRFALSLAQALADADALERLVFCGRHPDPPEHPLFRLAGVEYVYGLRRPRPDTTAVFLSVPDADLPEMAWALGGQGAPGAPIPVLHPSISLSGEVLAPLHGQGYTVGTFHPFAFLDHSEDSPSRLRGAPVLVSGERGVSAAARRIVQALGGRVIELPVTRRADAAGAEAVLLNGAAALGRIGRELLESAGLGGEEAEVVARSLVASGVRGTPAVDPGFAPSDEDVELHLRALPHELADVYRRLLDLGRIRS